MYFVFSPLRLWAQRKNKGFTKISIPVPMAPNMDSAIITVKPAGSWPLAHDGSPLEAASQSDGMVVPLRQAFLRRT